MKIHELKTNQCGEVMPSYKVQLHLLQRIYYYVLGELRHLVL